MVGGTRTHLQAGPGLLFYGRYFRFVDFGGGWLETNEGNWVASTDVLAPRTKTTPSDLDQDSGIRGEKAKLTRGMKSLCLSLRFVCHIVACVSVSVCQWINIEVFANL